MTILIDGYNLLHVLGFVGSAAAPGALHRARTRLIERLAICLDTDERQLTTIIFDAAEAPAGLPHELHSHGMLVRYAVGYEDADTLLEELIRAESTPRRLTVVSSDHRVQQAAQRRRATAIDSEDWLESLSSRRAVPFETPSAVSSKPDRPLTAAEVAEWLIEFGAGILNDSDASSVVAAPEKNEPSRSTPLKPGEEAANCADLANPFPAEYLEELPDKLE